MVKKTKKILKNVVKKYKAKVGSPFKQEDAQIVGETIDRLRNSKGEVTPEVVLMEAKKKTSPLHEFFEWEDSEAAHKFRLQQARMIVSHVVEVVVISGEQFDQRSFVSIATGQQESVYVTLQDAIETESYRKQLLNRAIHTLENLTVTMKMFREQEK